MEAVFNVLQATAVRPHLYGVYHWVWLAVTATVTMFLCLWAPKPDERAVRRLLAVVSIGTIVLEVYKQLVFTLSVENGQITAEYPWYIFPFQFCSTPMYVGLLGAFVKSKRIHRTCCAYLATYALIAGLSVMLYPEQVFTEMIGINAQSMLCHGSMIVVAVYLLYTGYVRGIKRPFFAAAALFAVMLMIAVGLNEWAYRVGITQTDTFNMFFVSPHCEGTLPVYRSVQEVLRYPWCLIVYFAAFTFGALTVLAAADGIRGAARKRKRAR